MTGALSLNRGRASGILLVLLGAWGAIVPFVGPYFGYAYTPDKAWAFTSGRLWLSVVPGAAAFLGGLLVAGSARMAAAGGLLAALGGAWFVIGQAVIAITVTSGSIAAGTPVLAAGSAFSGSTMRFLEGLGFFYGLGVLIVFFAALAIGRARARAAVAEFQGRMDDAIDREEQYGPAY